MATGAGGKRTARSLRLEAIVLAAGVGTRFGGAKLRAPWRDGVLLEAALAAACAAPVRQVIVVTGGDPALVPLVESRAASAGPRIRHAHADHHRDGMGASLAAGARELAEDCDGVFVFLGDMPLIPPTVPAALALALATGALAAAPTFNGQRGHPVLFGRSLIPALATLNGDAGARSVLSGLGNRLALVKTLDPGILYDIDRPGDLSTS